jgi:hypothetical protein
MFRVQAFILSHENGVYEVEARAEGIEEPFIFSIPAKSDNEAAMEAIHRVELGEAFASKYMRKN